MRGNVSQRLNKWRVYVSPAAQRTHEWNSIRIDIAHRVYIWSMAPVSRSSGLLAAEVGVAGGKMLAGWHIEGGHSSSLELFSMGHVFFSPEFREGLAAATCLHSSVCLKKSRLIVSVHQNRHVRIPQSFFSFSFSLTMHVWPPPQSFRSSSFLLLTLIAIPKKNPCIWILLIDLSSHTITRRVTSRTARPARLRIVSTEQSKPWQIPTLLE